MLRDEVLRVLARERVAADVVAAVTAALDGSGDDRELAALLQARRPEPAAIMAAFAGFVRVDEAAVLLSEAPLDGVGSVPPGRQVHALPSGGVMGFVSGHPSVIVRYPLRGRAPVVASGAAVAVGDLLSAGEVDLHDVITVFGGEETQRRLIAALATHGLDPATAAVLAGPMLSLARIVEPGASGLRRGVRLGMDAWFGALGCVLQRCVRAAAESSPSPLPEPLGELLALAPAAAYERWWQSDLARAWDATLRPEFPIAESVLTGYAALARHRDPPP